MDSRPDLKVCELEPDDGMNKYVLVAQELIDR